MKNNTVKPLKMRNQEFFVCLIMSTMVAILVHPASGENCQRRVCQYQSFEQNNMGTDVKLVPEDVDASLCTHIAYYGVWYDSYQESPIIANNETELNQIVGLKATYPNLKVLLFLYASQCKENQIKEIASSESTRQKFADNIIKYIGDHQFDGLVYGCIFLGPPADPEVTNVLTNIIIGLNQASTRAETGSNNLELVLYAFGERIFDSYDIAQLSANVDWIVFDATVLQGNWNGVTGHHSPLYPNYNNIGVNPQYSVDTAVKHWIDNGVPKDKLVVSLPSYGVQFALTTSESRVGAPATDLWGGHYHWSAYYEICVLLQNGGAQRHFIHKQRVPYLVDGNKWIGYDDVGSLKNKVRYIKQQKLGGFFFPSLHYDDTKGNFCGQGPYPLLKAINDECLI